MVLQNYQNFIAMTSNMIYFVAFSGGLKCPRKIHLNTQCPPWVDPSPPLLVQVVVEWPLLGYFKRKKSLFPQTRNCRLITFSNFSCRFLNPYLIIIVLIPVSKIVPFTVKINCSSNLKHFANHQLSASNFKRFS